MNFKRYTKNTAGQRQFHGFTGVALCEVQGSVCVGEVGRETGDLVFHVILGLGIAVSHRVQNGTR